MTEIKRYVDQYPVSYMAESDSGDWVDYDDHAAIVAALQDQVRALAAEDIALKHAMSVTLEHVSVLDTGQAGVAAMIINDALHNSESPATDAVIREIRAQAVDAAIDAMVKSGAHSFGDCVVAVNSIRSGEQA